MTRHSPVMLDEVIAALEPRDGGIYVDGTFGGGGYSRAILETAATTVFGIDRDPRAVTVGLDLGREYPGRFTILEGRYGDMGALMKAAGVSAVDGVVLDIGPSSDQLDDPARGFSFRADGPLDMRMESGGATAADLVNSVAEDELADILRRYGEERQARRVARAIVEAREGGAITSTARLAEIVRAVVHGRPGGIDPATRTFLALRIVVNDELGELSRGLEGAEAILAPGGRLAVVSFHSLEDRAVKNFLKTRSGGEGRGSRHRPEVPSDAPEPTFRLIHRRAARPGSAEVAANPRARSARLRAAERTAAPAWGRAAAA